jgi:hypothetical protein
MTGSLTRLTGELTSDDARRLQETRDMLPFARNVLAVFGAFSLALVLFLTYSYFFWGQAWRWIASLFGYTGQC